MDYTICVLESENTTLLAPLVTKMTADLPFSVLQSGERHTAFCRASGLNFSQVVSPIWAGSAVPLFNSNQIHRILPSDKTIAGHPLLWLNPELAAPYDLIVDGDIHTENQDLWVTRILLEAANNDWYDPISGKWIDVLALNNIELPELEAWFDGATNTKIEDLCAPWIKDEEIIDAAQELLPYLYSSSRCVAAWEIGQILVADPSPEMVATAAQEAQCIQLVNGQLQPWPLIEQLQKEPTNNAVVQEVIKQLQEIYHDNLESVDILGNLFAPKN
ncbi:hypothetical protein [Actinomyces vulturis]|uniref:hypothetical protein n=1 Tax=Actinomyces vulturis TaxID=1857645 RepID=UPI0008315109|nr:hypothetical protein [Actinomyces vulturis]